MTNLPEKELAAFLMLNRLGIENRRRTLELLQEGRTPQEILPSFATLAEEIGKDFNPEKELSLCWQKGIHFLTILDPNYPQALKEIVDPPLVLYIKGEIAENDGDAIAVVGTRHPSFYGRTQAKRFAGELAAKGLTIISGLARGVDQVAHEAALEVRYGRTIAVLGSGLDVVYPKENEKLYYQIAERGAALSEYALGTPPLVENFPRRNRIISGLSLGAFVVEAHSRSGSLITAHQALDQGREVFALPGPVDQLTSRGTHQLLKEGAMLVESPEDIFEALAVHLKRNEKTGDSHLFGDRQEKNNSFASEKSMNKPFFLQNAPSTCQLFLTQLANLQHDKPAPREKSGDFLLKDALEEDERIILEVLKEEKPLGVDEILDITGLDAAKLPGLLLKLELVGRIKRGQDGKYR